MVTKRPDLFTFPHSRFLGFDHIWNEIETLSRHAGANERGFPFHNIVKVSDKEVLLEMALAGFKKEDIDIQMTDGLLTIKGAVATATDAGREYLHQGVTHKPFVETFRLGEHVVVNGAELTDGLLVISMKVEPPEEQRPLKIELK